MVIRDLDRDADCAPTWIRAHLPRDRGPYFALRLAVRAVEAWFLADRSHAAASLHVPERTIPTNPDAEDDPKLTLVKLARGSRRASVRDAVVPKPGTRKAGPGYERWLMAAAQAWSFERAVAHSESLARAHRRLTELCEAWERHQG